MGLTASLQVGGVIDSVNGDMDQASIAVRMAAKGLVEAHRASLTSRGVLSQGPDMPLTLRRGMALVSAVALADGHSSDIASQVNDFTTLATRPVREWGPASLVLCEERNAILLDEGYGIPTAECIDLAEIRDEGSIVEDIFHEKLRTGLSRVGKNADSLYRAVRENIIRKPCRTRKEVLAFALEVPELASEIPTFFSPLPASALHGKTLRLCARCNAPLFADPDRSAYPNGRCAVRECRMSWPDMAVGEEHQIPVHDDWRMANPVIMTFWVGPGLPEIALYDALRKKREDVVLYPMCDLADIGIEGTKIGIDVKSYSSAAVLGKRFSANIGGMHAFRRRIVAVPDFWIKVDRDYLRTASAVCGNKDGIEFMSVSQVAEAFS
ncbi:hypothetical protein [Mesorhizobium waimense]|uniref:restriction endonuclease-related protein n=1 Tax=Mesorhizobium waimense TaxID=1300307 RepID=UPI001FE0FA59|nr:hypothetical protein [Mesorhizobium waimense]